MIISIIVAVSKNGYIGNNGSIPWKIKGEQLRFKELTTNKIIIMGRKSFEEIGNPLPNRRTIVVSRTKIFSFENCITVKNFDEALHRAKDEDEVFIAGGGEIYNLALQFTDRIYLTEVDLEIDGDTRFCFDETKFYKTYEKKYDGKIPFTYYTFERKVYD